MIDIDRLVDGLEIIAARAREVAELKAERSRVRRNKNARYHYARKKKRGLPARNASMKPLPDREDWVPNECCTCFMVAPCGYCTSASQEARDAT